MDRSSKWACAPRAEWAGHGRPPGWVPSWVQHGVPWAAVWRLGAEETRKRLLSAPGRKTSQEAAAELGKRFLLPQACRKIDASHWAWARLLRPLALLQGPNEMLEEQMVLIIWLEESACPAEPKAGN